MTGTKPDERIRTPMRWTADPATAGLLDRDEPWEPLSADDCETVNVAAQAADPDSLLATYRDLIRLRNARTRRCARRDDRRRGRRRARDRLAAHDGRRDAAGRGERGRRPGDAPTAWRSTADRCAGR